MLAAREATALQATELKPRSKRGLSSKPHAHNTSLKTTCLAQNDMPTILHVARRSMMEVKDACAATGGLCEPNQSLAIENTIACSFSMSNPCQRCKGFS
jgi:hypothetical protein